MAAAAEIGIDFGDVAARGLGVAASAEKSAQGAGQQGSKS